MSVIRSNLEKDHPDYPVLSRILEEIHHRTGGTLDKRFPEVVRDAIDFVLDPIRTARTRVTELDNVEKTFIGLKLEHFVRDLLDVPKGLRDLRIGGLDVDIKNTMGANWSIPQETYRNSEPCLLMKVDDAKSLCWLGLVIAKPEYLHAGVGNRDTKKGISAAGAKNILWIFNAAQFPPSEFAHLNMDRFRELRKIQPGAVRAAQFFAEHMGVVVNRKVVVSLLFDQEDPMKRLRENGGARDILVGQGILLLGGRYDRVLAKKLGLPVLNKNEWVALRARSEAEKLVLTPPKNASGSTDD